MTLAFLLIGVLELTEAGNSDLLEKRGIHYTLSSSAVTKCTIISKICQCQKLRVFRIGLFNLVSKISIYFVFFLMENEIHSYTN